MSKNRGGGDPDPLETSPRSALGFGGQTSIPVRMSEGSKAPDIYEIHIEFVFLLREIFTFKYKQFLVCI